MGEVQLSQERVPAMAVFAGTDVSLPRRRKARHGRLLLVALASWAIAACLLRHRFCGHDRGNLELAAQTTSLAFLSLDEKDGRFCAKEGDLCRCTGRVRYGRLFTWSDDFFVDGSVNCTAIAFGDPVPVSFKICKCYPTLCTTDMSTCTLEPCSCPTSRDPAVAWSKKTLMTGDGAKCWACEQRAASTGTLVKEDSPFCPVTPGRCSTKRSCKCANVADTKRVMKTKDGQRCWTCAVALDGASFGLDSGQKPMFWMLPMLWPFMDFPGSAWQVYEDCKATSTFLVLCVVGYVLQNFVPALNLNRFFSFYAPCMKKGELWRLFTYFMLHSDIQHLFINLMHLLDTIDLEGVPNLEVSLGAPLRCTRGGPVASVCYPDVGIGHSHVIGVMATVLAYGALVGTIKSFGALVQGASSVCFGVDGALIALYAVFLGAGLEDQLQIPEFGSFFWMRIGIVAFHIVIDVFQSMCGAGKDTVGTLAHIASLIAGFCYVVLVLPPMGDGSLFDSTRPYIVDCGMTSPKYVTVESANAKCLAFFRRGNGVELATAQRCAALVLAGGVLVSVANAYLKRHVSDDGIALCRCGDVSPPDKGPVDLVATRRAMLRAEAAAAREDLERLQRLTSSLDALGMNSGSARSGSSGSGILR